MPELEVLDISSKKAGSVNLPDDLFGIEQKDALMHSSVVNYLANQRQGTHATKTRGMISGGGRKPYRQKGTGRARSGTIRSPLYRGGGTVFGPHPRDYYYKMPKKARRLALYAALSAKLRDGELVVVDELKIAEPKTRAMAEIVGNLGLKGGSLLVVLPEVDRNVQLSARNIPGVSVMVAADLNAYTVLSHRKLMCTKAAVEKLAESGAQS